MPYGYDYYALRNLYIGGVLAFVPGMYVPDSTVASQGYLVGRDVQAIGTPPGTAQTLTYYGTPSDQQLPVWNAATNKWGLGTGAGLNPNDVGYDVVLLCGQSNMVSHGTDTIDTVYLDPPSPRIKQWGGTAPWLGQQITAIDPLYFHENRPGTVSHAMNFARDYLATIPLNRSVLLVPTAHSSTGFTTSSLASPPAGYTTAPGGGWDTSGGQGGISLYEFAIAQTNAAIASGVNNRIVAVLWLQGEADAGVLNQAQYASHLDVLIAGFRSRITGATSVPFLVGQMLPEHTATHSDYLAIQLAHLDTPNRNTRSAFYYGPLGYGNTTGSTELHYNNAGQRLLGHSAASVLALAQANVTGTAPVPPAAVTLTQSGTTVTAVVTRSAGRVTDYSVQYRVNGGSWQTYSHTPTLDVTFAITGFSLGNAVDVQVATVNEQGTSSYVQSSLLLVNPPNAPALGSASHTSASITATWTPAGTGPAATSFLVEAGPHPVTGAYTYSTTVAATATSGQITGLQPDTSYDYQVTPINAAGAGTAVTGTVSTDSLNPLLTDVGVAAFTALSVTRKLNTSYAGSCLQVRRSSDNTTQDIGFDGTGALDTGALLTFCGSSDGFVAKIYDQSGNGHDFTQTTITQQPKIVTAGVVNTLNGKPVARFDGVDDCLDSTVTGLYAAGAATILAVCELDTSAVASNQLLYEGNSTSGQFAVYTLTRAVTGGFIGGQFTNDAGTGVTMANGSIAVNTGNLFQLSAVDNGTQEANWISANVSKALTTYTARSGTLTFNKTRLGAAVNHQSNATSPWQGALSEIVAFTSALADVNRQAGETNQKSEYAIT